MTRFTRNSNKVLALASAMLAITFGHSFEWWCNNDSNASARNVDAREVWELAYFKVTKRVAPTPERPARSARMKHFRSYPCRLSMQQAA